MKRRLHYHLSGTITAKSQGRTEKINKLLPNIPMGNITKLNEQIYFIIKSVFPYGTGSEIQNLDGKSCKKDR